MIFYFNLDVPCLPCHFYHLHPPSLDFVTFSLFNCFFSRPGNISSFQVSICWFCFFLHLLEPPKSNPCQSYTS
jgi:hypothetical protein